MQNIGFKLGGEFLDVGHDGFSIEFDILFPCVYKTKGEAEQFGDDIYACMEKEKNGEVVIRLYEQGRPVETIRWEQWWKYKCCRIKEARKNKGFIEQSDFEPYSGKFEEIFHNFVGGKNTEKWSMQCTAFWVEPVLI